MKKALLISSGIVVVLVSALLILPVFFKGDILQIIERQASNQINAELKIGDMNLSMFKSFPDLNVRLKNVTITGKQKFADDTLLHIPLFEASLNLKSLISGNEVIINNILLKDTRLLPVVDTTGAANWDISLQEKQQVSNDKPESETDQNAGNTDKKLSFHQINVQNLYIGYNDYQNSTYASIGSLNLQLSGNFSATNTVIRLILALNDISFRQQNSVWVNKTNLNWQADIAANLQEKTFNIQKNTLAINDLELNLTGNVAILTDRYKMDLQLNAPDTQFETLLSLVPKALQHHIEGLKTSGDFRLNILAKGEYYENHLPAFQAQLQVNDASVQYPELPEAIRKINLDLNIGNPGGPTDSTYIRLQKLSFDIADNPFSIYLNILNPNAPLLNGGANGIINFANLKKALPLENVTLQGTVNTNLSFNGKYEYIEKEQFEKFIAKGNIQLNDILLVNADFPEGISIPQGNITVSPAYLSLSQLQAKIFSSDFLLQGKLSNYLPYIFRNETLKGNFSLISNYINLNEFIVAQMRSAQTDTLPQRDSITTTPSAAEGALEIPKNIDIQFSTRINTMLFDRLVIKNTEGRISLAHATADLTKLSMDLLNGNMIVNGQYNTANPQTPKVDFNLNITDFDINQAYHAFTFLKKSIPVAMNCEGRVSASMKFASTLDKTMSPVMTTANGGGFLESKGILLKDNPAMNQLASVLKNDELNRLSISHLKINFKLDNGNITVEPFKTSFAGNPVTIYGKQSVNGDLDYTLSITVNHKFFGKDINNLLKSIPGSNNIQSLDLDAKIGGTLTNPVIKPDLSKAIKAVTKEAEKELKGNVLQGLQNLFKKK